MFRALDFASASKPRARCALKSAMRDFSPPGGCWITLVADLPPPPQPTMNVKATRSAAGPNGARKTEPMAYVSGAPVTILSPWRVEFHGRMRVAAGRHGAPVPASVGGCAAECSASCALRWVVVGWREQGTCTGGGSRTARFHQMRAGQGVGM